MRKTDPGPENRYTPGDDRAGKRLMWLMLAAVSVLTIVFTVLKFRDGRPDLAYRGFLLPLFLLIPALFRLLRLKPCYRLLCAAYLFILYAYCYGSVFGGFKEDFSSAPLTFYSPDKISHFFSGMLFTIAGLCIFYFLAPPYQNPMRDTGGLAAGFGVGVSMIIAVSWEIFEMLDFMLTGNDSQNNLTTGVYDTMYDVITCLVGSLICAVAWMVYRRGGPRGFTAWVLEEFIAKNGKAARLAAKAGGAGA